MIAAADAGGGLSVANLIAILAVVVTVFGLLLTAIGVLLLRLIGNLSSELGDNRREAKQDVRDLRADIGADFAAVWTDIRLLRGINVASRPPVRTSTRDVDP